MMDKIIIEINADDKCVEARAEDYCYGDPDLLGDRAVKTKKSLLIAEIILPEISRLMSLSTKELMEINAELRQ